MNGPTRPSSIRASWQVARVSRIEFKKDRSYYYRQNNLADKVPTLTEMAYAVGSLAGPILGGQLYDSFSFQTTVNLFALVSIAYALIYAFVIFIPACRGKQKIEIAPYEPPIENSIIEEEDYEDDEPFKEERTYLLDNKVVGITVERLSETSNQGTARPSINDPYEQAPF